MNITISGRPGSGKSVVARLVADRLGLQHVSAGDFMRDMATERGVTILELSGTAEDDAAIDAEIDARTVRVAANRDDLVIDARLAWHFADPSFKVFLEVDFRTAARRIFQARRGSEVENVTLAATAQAIEQRTASETKRYLDYYGLDYTDHSNYDLVVDTSELSVEDVVDRITEAVADLV